jgi:hypothetical protein
MINSGQSKLIIFSTTPEVFNGAESSEHDPFAAAARIRVD